jgi:GAF domain-containing protein
MIKTDYKTLTEQLKALTEGVPHRTANLANASALLYTTLEKINWAGFYLMEDGRLVLNAFQGKPACIEIAVGRGVCGTAVKKDEIQLVADVHEFPGHIACDPDSRSEIVIPIHKNGEVFGVLDIDSPYENRFSADDAEGLSGFVRVIEGII